MCIKRSPTVLIYVILALPLLSACHRNEGPGEPLTIPNSDSEPRIWGCLRSGENGYALEVFGPHGGSWARGGHGLAGAASAISTPPGRYEEMSTLAIRSDPSVELGPDLDRFVELTVRRPQSEGDPLDVTAVMRISGSCS